MKSNRFWIIMLSSIAAVCLAAALLIWIDIAGHDGGAGNGEASAKIARIRSDGHNAKSIDLNDVDEPYTLVLPMVEVGRSSENPGYNVIAVERGRIRVIEASCSGGDCIRQGWISGSAVPIVCLPNRLVIQIEGSTDIDGVVR